MEQIRNKRSFYALLSENGEKINANYQDKVLFIIEALAGPVLYEIFRETGKNLVSLYCGVLSFFFFFSFNASGLMSFNRQE